MTDNTSNGARINQQIRVPQVRLILEDGSSPGIVDTWQALKQAKELGKDLIEINPRSTPPVAKIGDHGKLQYEQSKKAKEQKKAQKPNEVKEISFRPATDEHDLEHKLAKAREFLTDGNRVRLVVKFRGRELTHADLGKAKLETALVALADLTASYTPFSSEGKSIITIVSPKVSNG
jgi:translation initiation factor IF-3